MIVPRLRPRDWDPDRDRKLEELMAEQSVLERNTDRWLRGYRREILAEMRAEMRAEGLARERSLLVRQAARRFGADIGHRLGVRLDNVDDPGLLDRVGDLIVDCETGEQLLGGLDGVDAHSN